MRIVGSGTEMRGLYYSIQLQQELERLRVRPHTTPPLLPSPLIKPQPRRRKTGQESTLGITDELGIRLLEGVLERLTGFAVNVISAAEMHRNITEHGQPAETAVQWQQLANSLQGILLPPPYTAEHFNSTATTLNLQAIVLSNEGHDTRLDIHLKLSAAWRAQLSDTMDTSPAHDFAPIEIRLDVPQRDLAPQDFSFELDFNTQTYQGGELSVEDLLCQIQIWNRPAGESHQLLALGVKGLGIMYLGHLCPDAASHDPVETAANTRHYWQLYQQALSLLHIDIVV